MSAWLFKLWKLSRLIWIRAGLISLLAIVAAAASPVISPLLPLRLAASIDAPALRDLLNILSASMLAVTTFSLTLMATTHLSAAQNATPRVHRLLREDGSTQIVLATFMGAFVYALVTTVLLNLRIHDKSDFGTVYLFTVFVIALVIVAILRWIQDLTTLGSLDRTVGRVEAAARKAFDARRKEPHYGGRSIRPGTPLPDGARPLPAPGFGYVQHIDTTALIDRQDKHGGGIRLIALPGDWMNPNDELAHVWGGLAALPDADLVGAFVLGQQRTFADDPAYGLIVLSEIASRALSPGINDPRTAEDVTLRMLRLIAGSVPETPPDITHPWLEVPSGDWTQLLRQAFDPIARDGRAFVEVQMRLQKCLATLARHPDLSIAAAARDVSRRALAYAEDGMPLAEDLDRVRALAPDA